MSRPSPCRRTLLLAGAAGLAGAQSGPLIRIVVGYPAGATSDTLARVLAEATAREPGQPVIVDNKVGAGGRIGNGFVKNAPAAAMRADYERWAPAIRASGLKPTD